MLMILSFSIIQQRERLLSTSNNYYSSVLRSRILEISSSSLAYKYYKTSVPGSFGFAKIHTLRRLQYCSIFNTENWILF